MRRVSGDPLFGSAVRPMSATANKPMRSARSSLCRYESSRSLCPDEGGIGNRYPRRSWHGDHAIHSSDVSQGRRSQMRYAVRP